MEVAAAVQTGDTYAGWSIVNRCAMNCASCRRSISERFGRTLNGQKRTSLRASLRQSRMVTGHWGAFFLRHYRVMTSRRKTWVYRKRTRHYMVGRCKLSQTSVEGQTLQSCDRLFDHSDARRKSGKKFSDWNSFGGCFRRKRHVAGKECWRPTRAIALEISLAQNLSLVFSADLRHDIGWAAGLDKNYMIEKRN